MSRFSGGMVAVIGAGVSGICAAKVLKRNGYDVVIYEKSSKIGGVWSNTYIDVRLQNTWPQYFFSDFPFPTAPDRHPTKEQVIDYLRASVEHFQLNVMVSSEVVAMNETEHGWTLSIKKRGPRDSITTEKKDFCFVVISTGLYSTNKRQLTIPGAEAFKGRVIDEYQVTSVEDSFACEQVCCRAGQWEDESRHGHRGRSRCQGSSSRFSEPTLVLTRLLSGIGRLLGPVI